MDSLNKLAEKLQASPRMPVLFVGHGNPMHAIQNDTITETWGSVGKALPKPQAIVVISAHWLTSGTHVTAAKKPETIYDMYGFPPELYEVRYPANGDPKIAKEIVDYLRYETFLDANRGLDHGTWSVLVHLAPKADIPVIQISLNVNQSLPELYDFFASLKPLREKGVVFIGSGNIVHNLRMVNWQDDSTFDWALEFDDAITKALEAKDMQLLTKPQKMGIITQYAVPTDDHYRPLIAALALTNSDEQFTYFNDVFELGSISMRSFISTPI